jgi:RimJ/RimL family protein N-acetyltransferase
MKHLAWPEPVTLSGEVVVLEPLTMQHAQELQEAVRDGELWKLWYTPIPTPEGMEAEIQRRLSLQAAGSMLPFAVIERASDQAVGMTTYMNIDAKNKRVEIGSTWYRKRAQRTPLNTECKLLLLTHAFEALNCVAVEFRTSNFNLQSRRAIERLGAKLDGILRSHSQHPNGTLRDTYVYSILAAEWPAVKANLRDRLSSRTPSG